MKKVSFFSVVMAGFLSLLVACATSATPLYDVIALPQNFWVQAINNQGQVVGRTANGQAAVWYKGLYQRIPLCGFSEAFDINDAGTVLVSVVKSDRPDYFLVHHNKWIRIYYAGRMERINVPYGSTVHALNNAGQVIGETYDARTNTQRGFIWQNGQTIYITTPDQGFCTLTDINDVGTVTGFFWGMGNERPFIRQSNGNFTDLLTPGGDGRPESINNHDIAVGSYQPIPGYYSYPATWIPEIRRPDIPMTLLGDLSGKARDINDQGDVLGSVNPPANLYQVVIWLNDHYSSTPVLLEQCLSQPLRIMDTPALHLNNAGQIICDGQQPNGTFGYFFLQPRQR